MLRADPNDQTSEHVNAISNAVGALGLAGSDDGPGTVYPGAGRRLLLIAEESQSGAIIAVSAMERLHDREEALRLLRRVVTLDRSFATVAAQSLDGSFGHEGRAALRALYESDAALSGLRRQ